MIRIVSSAVTPEHLRCLREWFIAEWGREGDFGLDSSTVPGPLVAIEDRTPLGGLAFAIFQRPVSQELGLWINALFVAPQHRRKGVASQLIRAAEAEAVRFGEGELYALTDISELYLKLGWHCVRSDSAGTVVGTSLAK